jgi:peptide/nickel transport system substrate-binding protein
MKVRGQRAVAVVLLVALFGVLPACAGVEPPNGQTERIEASPGTLVPRRGGQLSYGLESDPNGLDPTRNAWDNAGIQLANALYDPLVAFDEDGRSQPYLAESLTPNGDFTRWRIKLRPGVVFHDGTALDADDLVIFFNALRASPITGPPAQLLTEARALDGLTVQLTTGRPWAALPALLAGQGGYVVAPSQLASTEGTSKPVGTGPFVLRRWQINERFDLARNPRYWREGLPMLDAVSFLVVNQGRERVSMIERGTLDATALTSPWDLRALEDTQARHEPSTQLRVERDKGDAEKNSVMFNTTRPPLDDVRVRRAIAYATDVRAIAAANDWPVDRLAVGPFDPASPFFSPADYPTYNVEKAKALIREYLSDPRTVAAKRREVTFTLQAAQMNEELVNRLRSQWADAGIKANVSFIDPKQVVRLAVFGEYDSMILRYFAAVDPDVLWHFFVSETIALTGISLNFSRVRDADLTSGMNEGRASADIAVRRRAYAKAQQALAAQMPHIWLNRSEWRVAASRRVHDAHNVTLPDGRAALPLVAGTFRLTETWLDR